MPKHIQVVHYETLPTRLQWFKLCGSINFMDFISKRETMARGGHHSVKMVTAVWPQTMMRVVIECLCMPHGCQQSVQEYDGRTLTVPLSPYIRFDQKKYMCEFSSKRRLLPSRWRGHVTVAYELVLAIGQHANRDGRNAAASHRVFRRSCVLLCCRKSLFPQNLTSQAFCRCV